MSIEQPLTRLRELISNSAPIHDQFRLCDSIIGDYKKEAEQMAALAKKYAVIAAEKAQIAAEHEHLKTTTSKKIVELEAENAKLKQTPAEEVFIHQSGVKFVRNKTTSGRLVPMCQKTNCTGTVDEIGFAHNHRIFCTLECGWYRQTELTLDQMRAEVEPPF